MMIKRRRGEVEVSSDTRADSLESQLSPAACGIPEADDVVPTATIELKRRDEELKK